MGDLTSKKLIYLKAALFLLGGFVSAILILAEQPNLKVAAYWQFRFGVSVDSIILPST